jgi:hypothetical protein
LHTEIPGTAVAIGWNSPRISLGASGFMSSVSSWLPQVALVTADDLRVVKELVERMGAEKVRELARVLA